MVSEDYYNNVSAFRHQEPHGFSEVPGYINILTYFAYAPERKTPCPA